jgi:Leucine-rich repeat (LRR) protein
MKFSEIRLSKTFSAIILIVVVSVFLLPVLSMNFMFWLAERNEPHHVPSFDNQIEVRVRTVTLSLKNLQIADPALFGCIKELSLELAKLPPGRSGGITSVVEIPRLSCANKGIVSLEGIDALEQLSLLHLQGNKIVDINPLAKLHELEEVDLSNNRITNLDALAFLSKLEELRLSGNEPDGIKPLLAIASLEEVDMPDATYIYCIELEDFFSQAKFVARQNALNQTCRGEYSSDIARIALLKKSGSTLTLEEESLLLEYELNTMKKDYKRKYQ